MVNGVSFRLHKVSFLKNKNKYALDRHLLELEYNDEAYMEHAHLCIVYSVSSWQDLVIVIRE